MGPVFLPGNGSPWLPSPWALGFTQSHLFFYAMGSLCFQLSSFLNLLPLWNRGVFSFYTVCLAICFCSTILLKTLVFAWLLGGFIPLEKSHTHSYFPEKLLSGLLWHGVVWTKPSRFQIPFYLDEKFYSILSLRFLKVLPSSPLFKEGPLGISFRFLEILLGKPLNLTES